MGNITLRHNLYLFINLTDWGVCEVECEAVTGYTVPGQTRFGLIENGTPCPGTLDEADSNQYSRRPGFYYACLEGYCQVCIVTTDEKYDGCKLLCNFLNLLFL